MLTTFDNKLALKYALKPYPQLSFAIVQPLVGKCPISDLVEILRQTSLLCGLQYPKKKPHYNDNAHFFSNQLQLSSPSVFSSNTIQDNKSTSFKSSSVLFRRCGGKGLYTNQCPSNSTSKPGVNHLQERTSDGYNNDKDMEFHLKKASGKEKGSSF